jgi:hypothetical protein
LGKDVPALRVKLDFAEVLFPGCKTVEKEVMKSGNERGRGKDL